MLLYVLQKFLFLKPVGTNGIKGSVIDSFLYGAHHLHSTSDWQRVSGISVLVSSIVGLHLDLLLCLMSNELNISVFFDTSGEVHWGK